MTQESMLFRNKDNIAPYVEQKRKELNGNYMCAIICEPLFRALLGPNNSSFK